MCFSQNTYIDHWFSENCNSCFNTELQKQDVLPDHPDNAWHNALVSFAHKDYKKAQYYLLADTRTDAYLKKLFQGHLFLKLGIYDKAEYHFNAIEINGNKSLQQVVLKSVGDVFYYKKEYDVASVYYQKAFDIKTDQSHFFTNEILENQGFIALSKEEYPKAEAYYTDILKRYQKRYDTLPIARTYSNLGNLYFEQYEDQKARKYFDSAYVYSRTIKDLKLKSSIAYNLYLISEVLKKHEEAIHYLEEHTSLKDSLQQQNMVWEVAQQKEAFNIALQQTELKAKTAERNIFITIAVGVFLLLLILLFGYRNRVLKNRQIVKLNGELKDSNDTKDQLFSIVAHDLRAPVTHLERAFQRKLLEKNNGIESSFLAKNYKAIQSVNQLLNNLLNWSLSQSNLISITPEWFALKPVIEQVLFPYQSLITEKQIKFETQVLRTVLLYADINTFKIALRNCVDNAIKFTPDNGMITLMGDSKENQQYTLSIIDSGIGVSDQVLEALFKKESRKVMRDTSGYKSTGLGLALTKKMIEDNEGVLAIYPNPDTGTTISMTLPFKNIN
jgi:signal transduction histidine kinase